MAFIKVKNLRKVRGGTGGFINAIHDTLFHQDKSKLGISSTGVKIGPHHFSFSWAGLVADEKALKEALSVGSSEMRS